MSLSFGASTFSFIRREPALVSMRRLRQVGYRNVDILAVPGHFWHTELDTRARSELRRSLDEDDIAVETINPQPIDLNIGSCLDEVRGYSVGVYTEVIRLAAEVNARGVVVVPGRVAPVLPVNAEDTLGWVADSIATLSEVARAEGLQALLVENHPMTGFPTAEAMSVLLHRLGAGNVKVAYDVANAEYVGENQLDAIRMLRHVLGQTHLSDARPGVWAHDPPGAGTVAFKEILQELDMIGFAGINVVEIVSQNPIDDYVSASHALDIKFH